LTAILDLDATGQAAAVRAGEISASELLDAAAERVASRNPLLNAVVHEWADKARDELATHGPRPGPFSGVPLLLKDSMCHTAGDPHTEGMQGLRRIGWREESDCDLATAFRSAGFAIFGKTNTPEFAGLAATEPLAYGATRNPWDLSRSVGGSSGGAAAAVAARMVAVAHGTDASGSIRVPASMCGVVGLKPSRGRTPVGPDLALWMGPVVARYVQNVLCRSTRDAAGILDAIAVPDPARRPDFFTRAMSETPRRLRVALFDDLSPFGLAVAPQCASAVESVARHLEGLGHEIERAHPPMFDTPPTLDDPDALLAATAVFFTWYVDHLERRTGATFTKADVEPYTWSLVERGRKASAFALYQLMEWMNNTAAAIERWWRSAGFDLVLSPTVPELPPLLGDSAYSDQDPTRPLVRSVALCAFTYWCNWTGDPAISLPLAWSSEGLPIGIQLAAPCGRDDRLLGLSRQLEESLEWRHHTPQIFASEARAAV